MFGTLLLAIPPPTPSKPTPPTPGTGTGADMAVLKQNNTVQDTQLEVLLNGLSQSKSCQGFKSFPTDTQTLPIARVGPFHGGSCITGHKRQKQVLGVSHI
jgi:hypothetical protein